MKGWLVMASVPGTQSKKETQVLYMPAVSVVVSGDRRYDQQASLTYSYSTIAFEKPSLLSRFVSSVVSALTFVIAVFIFAIPVTIASLVMIASMNSSVIPSSQNQNVPGIEQVVPSVEQKQQVVESAH